MTMLINNWYGWILYKNYGFVKEISKFDEQEGFSAELISLNSGLRWKGIPSFLSLLKAVLLFFYLSLQS